MARCRYCADAITEMYGRHESLTGLPCVGDHDHEPWPELAYREEPSGIPGVTRMVLVTRDN